MSYNKQSAFGKLKKISNCVGGKHYSATTNIRGDLKVNKKTGLPVKLLRGTCTTCKEIRVSLYQTINGAGLGDFFKFSCKATAKAAKNIGKKILNNPGRAL